MNKIYVGNLPFAATDSELEEFLRQFGLEFEQLYIARDAFTGRSRGFGFVRLFGKQDLEEAVSLLDGKRFQGRLLDVGAARPPKRRRGDRSNRWSAKVNRGTSFSRQNDSESSNGKH